MHGRVKKDILQRNEEEKAKEIEQVRTAFDVFGKLYHQRKSQIYEKSTHKLTTTALQFNPEIATLWNFRREILESGKLEGDMRTHLLGEMKLLEMAIRKSAKVYCIWHHRRWVLEKLIEASNSVEDMKAVLEPELDLCVKMLSFDERNFHCWNHRAFVISLMLRESAKQNTPDIPDADKEAQEADAGTSKPDSGEPGSGGDEEVGTLDSGKSQIVGTSGGDEKGNKENVEMGYLQQGKTNLPEAELKLPDVERLDMQLSEELINRNFSNYSAWHLRALQPPGKISLQDELEWLKQGIYTEPNDQSVWQYHHWLTALQCRQLRITHSAVLDGAIYIFLSDLACLRSANGPSGFVTALETESASSKSGTGGYAGSATAGHISVFPGHFVPLDHADVPGSANLCRPLSVSRRRWALAWRFVPEETAVAGVLELLGSLKPIKIAAVVETIANKRDGTAACSAEQLVFQGRPLFCDSADAASLSRAQEDKERLDNAEMLDQELNMIDELLEIEEDCRWARVARCRLDTMRTGSSGETQERAEERAQAYNDLSKLDPLRAKLHSDAADVCHQEGRVAAWLTAGDCSKPLDLSGLTICRLSAACLLRTFGLRVLHVNDNGLTSWGPLLGLLSLIELNASNNRLKGNAQAVFVLKRLQRVDLSRNSLSLCTNSKLSPPECLGTMDLSLNESLCQAASEDVSAKLVSFLGPSSAEAKNWEVQMDISAQLLCFRRHPARA